MSKSAKKKTKKNRQQQHQAQQRAKKLHRLRYGGLALLAVVVVALVGFYRSANAPKVDAPTEVMAANFDGPADAPVRIVEFGDFGCPSCRAWHNSGIHQQLKAEFGEQISFTFRHFPVITRQSPKAAEAGQCAAEQDAFWPYHDYIYEQAPANALSPDQLKSYAATLGLDTDQFNSCLDSGQYSSYVGRDQQAAFSAGAAGTPTFFINGRQVTPFYDNMVAMIQEELN